LINKENSHRYIYIIYFISFLPLKYFPFSFHGYYKKRGVGIKRWTLELYREGETESKT
jgi:hypothetical protein